MSTKNETQKKRKNPGPAKGTRPSGRVKGTPNKVTAATRGLLKDFIDEVTPDVLASFRMLDPKEKIDAYAKLLPYVAPRLQTTTIEAGEKLSEGLSKASEAINKLFG